MLLTAILVFIIPAIIIIGVNILRSKVFFGEADEMLNNYCADCRFNPKASLNKFLNAKMLYYGRINPIPVRWLVFYSNFVVPMLALMSGYTLLSDVIKGTFVFDAHSIIVLAYVLSSLFNVITIRGIDELAFYFNFLPAVLYIALIVTPYTDLSTFLLIAIVPIIGANVYYFIRRRGLFLTSLRDLKKQIQDQNPDNALS